MLKGSQKKYLRKLAVDLKPAITIGQSGLSDNVVAAMEEAFYAHELIKIKFTDFKEAKDQILNEIIEIMQCEHAGTIGHNLILFRPHPDIAKRKIILPQ